MSVFNRTSASRPRAVVRSTSPYESRSLLVEYDGTTTAAYLRDAHDATLGFCWVANHKAAPDSVDPARLDTGQAPLMPAAYTKHRTGGRKPLDPLALEVVWFEAGDGAVLLEHGEPLCVIPSWSDADRGMPGYSRDTIGQTPFARSFDDAAEGLIPRIDQARAHWKWQRSTESWPEFQQSVLGHLLARLGPGGNWWSEVGGKHPPRVGVSERPDTSTRPYTVLSTVGMGCQQMATDATPGSGHARRTPATEPIRVELALATTIPSQRAATVFRWLGPLPWRTVTSLSPGSCLRWDKPDEEFPLGTEWQGVVLVNGPTVIGGLPAPDLSGFRFGEDRARVRWLWVVPVTAEECDLADEQGTAAVIRVLDRDAGDRYIAR